MGEEPQGLRPGDILERIVAYLPSADLFKSQLGCKNWYRCLLSTPAGGIHAELAVREEPWVFTLAHCDKEEDHTALLTPCAYSLRSGRSHRLPGASMCPDGVGGKFLAGSGFLGFQEDGRLSMGMWFTTPKPMTRP